MDYPHRTYCDVVEEMRKILKNLGIFSVKPAKQHLGVLIEELQTIGNRMEARLWYQKDIEELHVERKKLRKEVEELKLNQKPLNCLENDDADI